MLRRGEKRVCEKEGEGGGIPKGRANKKHATFGIAKSEESGEDKREQKTSKNLGQRCEGQEKKAGGVAQGQGTDDVGEKQTREEDAEDRLRQGLKAGEGCTAWVRKQCNHRSGGFFSLTVQVL